MASARDRAFEDYVNRSFSRIRGAQPGAIRARFNSMLVSQPGFRRLMNKRVTDRPNCMDLATYLVEGCYYDAYTAAKVATFWNPYQFESVYAHAKSLTGVSWGNRRVGRYNPRARGDFAY